MEQHLKNYGHYYATFTLKEKERQHPCAPGNFSLFLRVSHHQQFWDQTGCSFAWNSEKQEKRLCARVVPFSIICEPVRINQNVFVSFWKGRQNVLSDWKHEHGLRCSLWPQPGNSEQTEPLQAKKKRGIEQKWTSQCGQKLCKCMQLTILWETDNIQKRKKRKNTTLSVNAAFN